MIFGIGFSMEFWPEFATFFASKFWPESLFFLPWREKRETWKSLESIAKTIVSWHVALCNSGTFSKTDGRKTQRKTPRKNFQNPCQKFRKIVSIPKIHGRSSFSCIFSNFGTIFGQKRSLGPPRASPGGSRAVPWASAGALGRLPGRSGRPFCVKKWFLEICTASRCQVSYLLYGAPCGRSVLFRRRSGRATTPSERVSWQGRSAKSQEISDNASNFRIFQ